MSTPPTLPAAPVNVVGEPTEAAATLPLPATRTGRREYVVGTLRYSLSGLVILFVWLLWGDFVWTVMELCVTEILPLKLTHMGASDTLNQTLNGALSYSAVFVMAPIISVSSDRHRGRLGRRIPYLLWSTPFVGAFLVLMGSYESLTSVIAGSAESVSVLSLFSLSRTSLALVLFGAAFVAFDIANVFVNTIYWYLFNDVVPTAYLSRFLSLFRIVGGLANMAFAKFVLPHALDHFQVIFVTIGIVYVIGFMGMCLFVREGKYPPPKPVESQGGFFSRTAALAKSFARECFTHKLYWYFFLTAALTKVSYQAGRLIRSRDNTTLGLTMDQIASVAFYTAMVTLLLQYPAGWLSDKLNPIRVYVFTRWVGLIGICLQLLWIFKDFGRQGNLTLMYIISLTFLPFTVLSDAAELPMYMRLLPRDRYGQFCSANAMIRALAVIFAAVLSGLFLDLMKRLVGNGWHYRYIPLWALAFQIPSLIFMMLLYRSWKQCGGHPGYVPPGSEVTSLEKS